MSAMQHRCHQCNTAVPRNTILQPERSQPAATKPSVPIPAAQVSRPRVASGHVTSPGLVSGVHTARPDRQGRPPAPATTGQHQHKIQTQTRHFYTPPPSHNKATNAPQTPRRRANKHCIALTNRAPTYDRGAASRRTAERMKSAAHQRAAHHRCAHYRRHVRRCCSGATTLSEIA